MKSPCNNPDCIDGKIPIQMTSIPNQVGYVECPECVARDSMMAELNKIIERLNMEMVTTYKDAFEASRAEKDDYETNHIAGLHAVAKEAINRACS